MSDTAAPEPAMEDAAAVGFAMLMADVHAAVAAAGEEITTLSRVVQQGIGNPPILSPHSVPTAQQPAKQRVEDGEASATQASRKPVLVSAAGGSPARAPKPPASEAIMPVRDTRSVAPKEPDPPANRSVPEAVAVPDPLQAAVGPRDEAVRPAPVVRIMRAATAQHLATQPRAAPTVAASPRARSEAAAPIAVPASEPSYAGTAGPDAVSPPVAVATPAPAVSLAPKGPLPLAIPAAGQPSATAPGGAPSVPLQDEPPARTDGTDVRMHGDVFLDGVRVGHWMSDTLARAAGGPARGATGHDPLMGPRWPGALQGR